MPNKARDHEENRKVVCITCMRKCKGPMTAFQADRLSKLYQISFDICDSRVPQGMCDNCRTTMRKRDEGTSIELPKLYDFMSIRIRAETRGQTCDCLICKIGRLKLNEKHPLEVSQSEEKAVAVRCHNCLSPIGRGLPHKCNQLTFRGNLQVLAAQDKKAAEQIASSVISNTESSPKGTIRLAKPSGGHPLPVTPGNFCCSILSLLRFDLFFLIIITQFCILYE